MRNVKTQERKDKYEALAFISTNIMWIMFSISINGCLFNIESILLSAIIGLLETILFAPMVAVGVRGNKYGYIAVMLLTSISLSPPLFIKLITMAL